MPECNEPGWTGPIERFVEKLRDIADERIDPQTTVDTLEDLHLRLEDILQGCLIIKLAVDSQKMRRKIFLHIFEGKYQQRLKNAYFGNAFCSFLCKLQEGLLKSNGQPLAEKERNMLEKFLRKVGDQVLITIWIDLYEMLSLVDSAASSISLTLTIAVTGRSEPKCGASQKLPPLDVLKRDLPGVLHKMPGIESGLKDMGGK